MDATVGPGLIPEIELDARETEVLKVHDWRVHQLSQLGIPRFLAAELADEVDWHDVDALVRRGCPPLLAAEIAR
jgi:hypothetical protein